MSASRVADKAPTGGHRTGGSRPIPAEIERQRLAIEAVPDDSSLRILDRVEVHAHDRIVDSPQ